MDEMRMMQDNKHYKAEKTKGFWSFVTRDPGDYQGRHRLGGHYDASYGIWLGCDICRETLGLARSN